MLQWLAPPRDVTPFVAGDVLSDTVRIARPLAGHLRIETCPPDRGGWIDNHALGDADTGPLAALMARFTAAGFGANRKAAAASLMLRHGWACGFSIGAYLAAGRVARIHDFALKFSTMTLVEGLWIRDADFLGLAGDPLEGAPGWGGTVSQGDLRAEMLAGLIAFTEPLIARQHRWSGFSRHALWSMAVSSWAAQFVGAGEVLGERDRGLSEARAVLALDPEIARAAPELYEVSDGVTTKVCQNRAGCCLYFKGPRRHFCASCPIIPRAERLERNLEWVKEHTREARRATG